MADDVKRDYRSALRSEQARATRRAIVAAASQLFVENGYGATTIDAIARPRVSAARRCSRRSGRRSIC